MKNALRSQSAPTKKEKKNVLCKYETSLLLKNIFYFYPYLH